MSVKLTFAQVQCLRKVRAGARRPDQHPASTVSVLLAKGLLDKTRDERTGASLLHVTSTGENFVQ
jgi:hypothetical protein